MKTTIRKFSFYILLHELVKKNCLSRVCIFTVMGRQ